MSALPRPESAAWLLAGQRCMPHLYGAESQVRANGRQTSDRCHEWRRDRTHGDSRKVDERVLSDHHLLNQTAVTELHQLRMVEGGGDLAT